MRTVILAISMAGAAWAQQEIPKPDRPPKLGARERAPEVAVRGGLELAYDDNIIDLSKKQIRQFEDGTKPQKFRIEEEDDIVTSPWAEVRLKAWLFAEPTRFSLKARANAYQENSFANYEKYALAVRQDLGRHEAGIEYDLEADVYHRELEIVVPGPNLWDSAFYSEHEIQLYTRHEVREWLSVKPFAGFAVRDFESPFQYRDLRGFFVGLRPAVEINGSWTAFLQYRYRDMDSEAGSAEPDTSYEEHEFEPGVSALFFGKVLEVGLRHRWRFREYTTSNSPLVDPAHVDREDVRQRTILEATVKLNKNWAVEARYVRRSEDSDRPFDTGDTSEEVGSDRNVFVIGVAFTF